MIHKLFCKHDWEVKVNEVRDSAFEQLQRLIMKSGESTVQPWVFEHKTLVVLACKKCGKLKKYVEEI